jgi:hypothetical protein
MARAEKVIDTELEQEDFTTEEAAKTVIPPAGDTAPKPEADPLIEATEPTEESDPSKSEEPVKAESQVAEVAKPVEAPLEPEVKKVSPGQLPLPLALAAWVMERVSEGLRLGAIYSSNFSRTINGHEWFASVDTSAKVINIGVRYNVTEIALAERRIGYISEDLARLQVYAAPENISHMPDEDRAALLKTLEDQNKATSAQQKSLREELAEITKKLADLSSSRNVDYDIEEFIEKGSVVLKPHASK